MELWELDAQQVNNISWRNSETPVLQQTSQMHLPQVHVLVLYAYIKFYGMDY